MCISSCKLTADFGIEQEELASIVPAAESKAGLVERPLPGTPRTPKMANPLRKTTNVLQVTAAPAWAEYVPQVVLHS